MTPGLHRKCPPRTRNVRGGLALWVQHQLYQEFKSCLPSNERCVWQRSGDGDSYPTEKASRFNKFLITVLRQAHRSLAGGQLHSRSGWREHRVIRGRNVAANSPMTTDQFLGASAGRSMKSSLPIFGEGAIVWPCAALEFSRLSGARNPGEPQPISFRHFLV